MGRIADLTLLARITAYRLRTSGREGFDGGRALPPPVILESALREAMRILSRHDCAIVVSHPKSGRTWLRFMLDRLGLHLRYQHPSGCSLPDEWQEKRIIFLHRDPRDVLVSFWYHATRRQKLWSGSLSDLIADPELGLESLLRLNLYWKSVVDASDRGLALAYEDLHADAAAALQRVARFVHGRSYAHEHIARAVAEGRFERMHEVERSGKGSRLYGNILAPADPMDENSYKTRRGRIGAWKTELAPEDAALAERLLNHHNYFNLMSAHQIGP
jgi:hypothetical protein